MYSISDYGWMISDPVRTQAYAEALRSAIKPGAVVLDIGTGTGFFALLACKFGASRVYAVEPSDAIQVARETVAVNRLDDKIVLIQDTSNNIHLPERVDVIISDLRGVFPCYGEHFPSIIDARERFLAPGGVLIPQQDTLWASVVEAPLAYKPSDQPWVEAYYGCDLSPGRARALNTWRKLNSGDQKALSEARCFITLDYFAINQSNLTGEAEWTVQRSGTAHGLAIWFDSLLAPGITLSNAPDQPDLIYKRGFFPLLTPVEVAIGDRIVARIQAIRVAGHYEWRWRTSFLRPGTGNEPLAAFDQSTFLGSPVSTEHLQRLTDAHIPSLGKAGRITQTVLNLMGEGRTMQEISQCVSQRFPDEFPTWQAAKGHVAKLSEKYSSPSHPMRRTDR